MYGYYWGFSAAKIELILGDCPLTVYKKREDDHKPRPGDPNYKPDEEKLRRSVEKWKERKKKRKFDLKHFLATGEKIPNQEK